MNKKREKKNFALCYFIFNNNPVISGSLNLKWLAIYIFSNG